MNKAEIIRKISKKAGVPDTEAKKFFEIFLKHASDILKAGESLKIPGVGLFQLRVGQIENSESGKDFIYSDLIVFIDEDLEDLQESEEIIFNVPSGMEEDYQPIDSYFSLSIGKPIIPLKGVKAAEFFIPPSGTELRSLIESKVSRILEEAEKVEGGRETETILLKSKDKTVEESFDWNKLDLENEIKEQEEKVPDRSDFLKTREFENLSWDFGENLSEELEEEPVPETESDIRSEEDTYEREIEKVDQGENDWEKNSEEPHEETVESEPNFEEEDFTSETLPDGMFEEETDEESEPFVEEKETADEEINDSEFEEMIEEETEGNISEQGYEQPEEIAEDNLVRDETEIEEEIEKEEEPFLKNFQRVSSLTKEFNTNAFDESEEKTEEETPKKITEVRGGFQKVRRTTAEFDFDLSGIKGLDEEDAAAEKEQPGSGFYSRHEYRGYRKKSNLPSLIITFVVVIVLAGIIFLYLKLKNENHQMADKTAAANNQTKVIDRNYDVPVTYPNDSSNIKTSEQVNGDISKTGNKENVMNKNETKTSDLEVSKPIKSERIGYYIYKYPEGIVVQVSSWKNKSIALKEVEKYRDDGYNAFAEKATIPGMGLYYRVRVGYFNSLDEAKKFANRNQ